MSDSCQNTLTVKGRGVSKMLKSIKSKGSQKPLAKLSSTEPPTYEKNFVHDLWLSCNILYSGISKAKYWTVSSGIEP